MSSLRADLRQAFRLFRRQPAFTVAAMLVLALGIGANSAVITLVNTLLLKPRPGQGSERLVGIYSRDRTRPDAYRAFSFPAYADVRDRGSVFEQVTAFTVSMVGLREGERTRRVFAAFVSATYFETLGVALPRGRVFSREEERPDAALPVAIISDTLWRRLGADPSVLGQTVTVSGRPLTIVGVAPRGFTGTSSLVNPDVYLPTGMFGQVATDSFRDRTGVGLGDRRSRDLMLAGRLRPGVSIDAANTALDRVARDLETASPAENKDHTLLVSALPRVSISTSPQDDRRSIGLLMGLLMAMAASVLVIACLNLANMLLARGAARRKEIAIRQAIGGSRRQIVRQLLVEGSVLSLAGAAGGLLFAYWSVRVLAASFAGVMPFSLDFDAAPDARVLAATLLAAVGAMLVFGLGPALSLSRADVLTDLREQSSEPAPRGRLRLLAPRHLLVVAQVALSLVLLAAGGLFVRSALNAGIATPGYDLDRGLVANVDPSLAGADEAEGRAIYRRLMQRLRGLPGVESASLASLVAYGSITETRGVAPAGTDLRSGGPRDPRMLDAYQFLIGAGYFRTLGIPVLRGREFTDLEEDAAANRHVAIVDEPLARRLWPGQDALGQRVTVESQRADTPSLEFEVVGVVAGTRHDLTDREAGPHLYLPFGSNYRGNMYVHVLSRGNEPGSADATLATVRSQLRAEGDRLPVLSLATLTGHRDTSIMMWTLRTGGRLFLSFGLIALGLAVIGLYAVKAYLVARRTREIAIRMTLGATEADIKWMVLREGLAVTTVGLGLGFALAIGAGRLAQSLLFDVSAFDPVTFSVAPMFLLGTAAVASYLPARRAARVAPIVAVRE